MTLTILIVLAAFGLYLVSLLLNPYTRCPRCQGKARIGGWIATRAHHPCSTCKGTGQVPRFGRRLFFGEPKR